MFESPIKLSGLIISALLSIIIAFAIFLVIIFDDRTKIVFCDVGQGDGVYIRVDNRFDIVIDAGPDKSILNCLGKYMPFWDREIEIAFLSHPNDDHYNGYSFITDRFKIDRFYTVNSPIVSKTYNRLIKKITDHNIPVIFEVAGTKIVVGNSEFDIFWPPIGFSSSNDNDFSHIILFQENGFSTLFTGDASPYVLGRLSHGAINKINILKVPHHGSKNGLTKTFLDLADPEVAVISVGKGNSYGHPHKEILDMLKAKNIDIKRTDVDGDIEFKLTK